MPEQYKFNLPLTPLENHLRQLAGQSGYEGGFIAHYLLPVVYPEGLTREIQLVLGSIVVVVNLAVYGYALWVTGNKKKIQTDNS